MPASVSTMFAMANARAASTPSMPCPVTTPAIMPLVWLVAFAFQNCAIAVCSAVRTVLVAEP